MFQTRMRMAGDQSRRPAGAPLETPPPQTRDEPIDAASTASLVLNPRAITAREGAHASTPTTRAGHVWFRAQHLQDRKVFQWMMAYLGIAWMILQAVDVLSDIWSWSLAGQKALCLALVLGFFPALVVAWHHGEKGRQRMTASELLLLVGLILGSGAVMWSVCLA